MLFSFWKCFWLCLISAFTSVVSFRMWMELSTMLKTGTGRRSVWESPSSVAVGKAIKPLKALDITPSTSTHLCDTHTHTPSFSSLPSHPFIYISGSYVNWDQMLISLLFFSLYVCDFIYTCRYTCTFAHSMYIISLLLFKIFFIFLFFFVFRWHSHW